VPELWTLGAYRHGKFQPTVDFQCKKVQSDDDIMGAAVFHACHVDFGDRLQCAFSSTVCPGIRGHLLARWCLRIDFIAYLVVIKLSPEAFGTHLPDVQQMAFNPA
jgi:hypothetical protein